MPRITFIDRDGSRRDVEAETGGSVMEVAVANGVDIEAACEGCLACATCHMYVDRDWFGKIPAPGDDEKDMLDLAFAPTPLSRLTCQIRVAEDMDGAVFTVPPEE